MADGGGLENRYGGNLIQGSNPWPSATTMRFTCQNASCVCAAIKKSRPVSLILVVARRRGEPRPVRVPMPDADHGRSHRRLQVVRCGRCAASLPGAHPLVVRG